jgi:hypothetical protein
MRKAWAWFNRVATVLGVASFVAQLVLWVWMSIEAGRPATYLEVHHQLDRRIEELLERF